ncbi:imidazole glycerol phosphate synthase subunit HisF [bacterium]|nr:imidazole glycerol phosphate synthase subunit HisF [bacterium]
MLTARLIPCLDVRDGRVVKGTRFQNLRDMGDPAELAARYEEQGADEIVLLDVAATRASAETAVATVARVRARLGIPLTVGGGVRTADDAGGLLTAGADKVSVNSAAVARPDLVAEIADRYGRQCCVVAVDARRQQGRWCVLTHAGTREARPDAIAWIDEAVRLGAGEILLTSWDEDGRGQGYDLALLAAARRAVPVPIIASGGGRTADHLADALSAGASAVLVASVLHDGTSTVASLKGDLIGKGHPIRT